MKRLDKQASLMKLKSYQANINFESEEDEGAAMFYGEIESIINALETMPNDRDVINVAEQVGLESQLVFV